LLDLPAHDRRAVRRLVQRAAIGVSSAVGRPDELPIEPQGRPPFCPHCGTQLTFQSEDSPEDIDVTSCSLDDPDAVPAKDHTRTSSKLRWIELGDGLPAYRETRSDG
jgi:hypothetical protein